MTERCEGMGRRACSHVLIKCEPLPIVDEGQRLRGGEAIYYVKVGKTLLANCRFCPKCFGDLHICFPECFKILIFERLIKIIFVRYYASYLLDQNIRGYQEWNIQTPEMKNIKLTKRRSSLRKMVRQPSYFNRR